MAGENVYIALIISNLSNINLSSYDLVINLFNTTYPNNKLIIEKYFIDGSVIETDKSLNNFISKYPTGKRVTVSTTTSILINCSNYMIKNNLNIINLSISASSNIIKTLKNALTYNYFNQYAILSDFMIYNDYQMKNIKVLYERDSPNDSFFKDYLEQLKIQAKLLDKNVDISFLKQGQSNYNIKEKSMIIILASTTSLKDKYITPNFLKNIPKESFILLSVFNANITNIFGDIPTIVQLTTNINYTTTSQIVYNAVKDNPSGFSFSIYPFYDVLFVLNDFCTNGLEITKDNYVTINPYKNNPPAWIINTAIDPSIGGSTYGKYQYTFTKNSIIGKNISIFLKYYRGGQQQLPNSYSIFKIVGITPNNPSLIEYDEAEYYKICKNNKLFIVRFNSNVTLFPLNDNLNIGSIINPKFIYKYNSDGYFSFLEKIYLNKCRCKSPKVNLTMSKVPIILKYKN
jgi:hypothetical protein